MSTETKSSGLDGIKWLVSILLIAAAVYGNHFFSEEAVVVRAIAIIVVIGVALLIALQTEKGKEAMTFAQESRMEVRKVVWPSRQEAIQTTLIIFVFVFVVSLFLWGVDAFLAWGVEELMSL